MRLDQVQYGAKFYLSGYDGLFERNINGRDGGHKMSVISCETREEYRFMGTTPITEYVAEEKSAQDVDIIPYPSCDPNSWENNIFEVWTDIFEKEDDE